MPQDYYYRECIKLELERRLSNNSAYSLRAFARSLRLEPGALSQFLSGKRVPSYKSAQRLIEALGLSPENRNRFLVSLARHQLSRGLKRMSPAFRKMINSMESPDPRELTSESFELISDWYYYAIMLLAETEDFRPDERWIASRFNITPVEAKLALDRLIALKLLKDVDGALRFADQAVTTADKDRTTPAHKRWGRQFLEKAIQSLEDDPLDIRSMTGMTMAIDPAKLPEARKLILEFNRKMSRFLESGRKKEVYQLQISLFPLQKRRSD